MHSRTLLMIVGVLAVIAPARAGLAVELSLEHGLPGGCERITALAFGPAGTGLAYGGSGGQVVLVDPETGKGRALLDAGGKEITAVAVSPDGRLAAAATKAGAVWLLGLGEDAVRIALKEARGRTTALEFSGDGRLLAAGGDKGDILVWEVPSGQLHARLRGHAGEVLALAFQDGQRSAISVGRDGRMILWDCAAATPLRQYELAARTMAGSGTDVTSATISRDHLVAAVGIEEHALDKGGRSMIFKYHLAFFDVSKGVLLKTLEDNPSRLDHLAIYPENCFVAFDHSTLQEHSIALRNIESGSVELALPTEARARLLEFSPDGRWLAGAVEAQDRSAGARLDLWSVDYTIPASGCFMGRIRLISGGEPLRGTGAPSVAAVLPFATDAGDENLGRAAATFVVSGLSGNPNLRLVERSRVDDIVGELKLQRSGLVDKGSAVKAGKLLGAALMITGDIVRAGADLVVSARVIDVRTGAIIASKQVHCGQCGADDLLDAVAVLTRALVGT